MDLSFVEALYGLMMWQLQIRPFTCNLQDSKGSLEAEPLSTSKSVERVRENDHVR
jgi:hypothetical protein